MAENLKMEWKYWISSYVKKNVLASALEQPGKAVSIARKLDALTLDASGS